jgi:hypothetical protein
VVIEERVREAGQPDSAGVLQEETQAGQLQVERVPHVGGQEAQPVSAGQSPGDHAGSEQAELPRESAQQVEPGQPESMRQALSELKHALEQQAERKLPELLGASLTALFSEAARAAIERELEHALHAAMARGLEALPDGAAWQALEQETEQSLQAIVHETLDSVFGGAIGDELAIHSQQAIQALLQRDNETAQEHIRDALRAAVDETLTILERHRKDAIGIAIHVLTKASEETVATKIQDGVAGVLPGSDETENATDSDETVETAEAQARPEKEMEQEDTENHPEPVKEKLDDQGQNVRDQLEEETKGLKQRMKEAAQSGTKEGTRSRQFGRPPSGKTLGHPPSRRAPPGRPPSRRSSSR